MKEAYVICKESTVTGLEYLVKTLINVGYIPQGGIAYCPHPTPNICGAFLQAMYLPPVRHKEYGPL